MTESKMDDCTVQTVTIVGNLFLFLTLVLVGILRKWWLGSREASLKRIQNESRRQNLRARFRGIFFEHHLSIWIFTMILFLGMSLSFAEGLLVFLTSGENSSVKAFRDSEKRVSSNTSSGSESVTKALLHLRLWSSVSSLFGLSIISLFFYYIESRREPKYLSLNIIYFGVSTVLAIVKIQFYFTNGLSLAHVKVFSEMIVGIALMTLLILTTHASIIHVSNFKYLLLQLISPHRLKTHVYRGCVSFPANFSC